MLSDGLNDPRKKGIRGKGSESRKLKVRTCFIDSICSFKRRPRVGVCKSPSPSPSPSPRVSRGLGWQRPQQQHSGRRGERPRQSSRLPSAPQGVALAKASKPSAGSGGEVSGLFETKPMSLETLLKDVAGPPGVL